MSTQTKAEMLNTLYQKYGLTKEDVFRSPQGWTIITRSGIDKIQAGAKIQINYEPVIVEREFIVLKAIGKMGDEIIQSFGEADRKTNCRQTYPVAMAEKRAMSRIVLKLTGFYALGVFGEDEADDFGTEAKKYKKELTKDTL
jgi:hypothetical protein